MDKMVSFEEGVSSDKPSAVQILEELGLETYGSPEIADILCMLYRRGLCTSDSVVFSAVRDALRDYENVDHRRFILGNFLQPLHKALLRDVSTRDLCSFINLSAEARRYVTGDSSLEFTVAERLDRTGLFQQSFNCVNFIVSMYSEDEISKVTFSQDVHSDSLLVILNTFHEFSITESLPETLEYAKKYSVEEINILIHFVSMGLSLAEVFVKYIDVNRVHDVCHVLSLYVKRVSCKNYIHITMLFDYLYKTVWDLQNMEMYADGGCNLWLSVIVDQVNVGLNREISTTLSKLLHVTDLDACGSFISSFEILLDGVSTYLLPIDFAIDESYCVLLRNYLQRTKWIDFSLCDIPANCVHRAYSKLVIKLITKPYTTEVIRPFIPNIALDARDQYAEEYSATGLLGMFADNLGECKSLFDLRTEAYLSTQWKDKLPLFYEQDVSTRFAYFSIISACKAGVGFGYNAVLNQPNLGAPIVKVLHDFIRPDDGFFSALYRFQLFKAGRPASVWNRKFEIKTNQIVYKQHTYDLLKVLSGDNSFVSALKDGGVQ